MEEFKESDIYETFAPSRNFVSDLTDSLQQYEHQKVYNLSNSNSNPSLTIENAIAINQEMQNLLRKIKSKVEIMLEKCRNKYTKNAELLENATDITQKQKRFKSYIYCGYPFFKNDLMQPAPLNSDYLFRRNVLKEMFANDLLSKQIYQWTLRDKTNIIKGIKQQVINYLIDEKNIESLSSPKNIIKFKSLNLTENNSKQYNKCILRDLLKKAGKNFKINWFLVSVESLGMRHTESSAEAMWEMYLKPEINRSKWSIDESKKLLKIAQKNQFTNWSLIAQQMGNRSEYQCFTYYHTTIIETLKEKNIKWSKEDDELLLQAIESSRVGNIICWNIVQQYFPHRNKKQLNTRYNYSLNPQIIRGKFTKEEDCLILAAVEKYGEKFAIMPVSLFPGRSIVQIRNRYYNTIKFVNIHQKWSLEDDQKLMDYVEIYGTGSWRNLADEFGYRSRHNCRQRYTTIMKFKKKYPNATLNDIPRKYRKIQSDITRDNWVEKMEGIKLEYLNECQNNKIGETPLHDTTYTLTLRCLEKQYYNYFKFSYNYELNQSKETSYHYNPVFNLNFLINLFEIEFNQNILISNRMDFTKSEFDLIENLITYRKNSINLQHKNMTSCEFRLFPPNWSTLLGFRGICIQCSSKTHNLINKTTTNKGGGNQDSEKVNQAKALFKQRFYIMFYKTILMSRVNSNIINSSSTNLIIKKDEEFTITLKEELEPYYDLNQQENTNILKRTRRQQTEYQTKKKK